MKTAFLPALLALAALRAVAAESPSFSGDIRPILSQHCFKCHGPDKQKAELRLDVRDAALKPAESGERAIVPGQPAASELLLRVTSHDKDEVMPPKNEPLTAEQIATLRAWIAAGAEYEAHWAYVKPVRPPAPVVPASALESQNPIDAFAAARLERAGRQPSPPADRYTLIRRVSLDLTGLPPTPEQADAFVADTAPEAYEKIVDRLLASPRYGERWATPWLDLARYGDSAGYQHDVEMPLWPYRDWVIRAFNADLPFDQFTRWQIAGDLLPREPDNFDPIIATGFHRGATATLGADQNHEELRAQLLWDRVNTVGATWLGETLECAQCHTHKFDPITQTDYYRLYAYFNRTANELTKVPGSHYFITGGILELPDAPERRAREQALRDEIRAETDGMIDKLQQATRKELPVPLRFVMATPPEFREAERILFLLENLKERTPPIAKKSRAPAGARSRADAGAGSAQPRARGGCKPARHACAPARQRPHARRGSHAGHAGGVAPAAGRRAAKPARPRGMAREPREPADRARRYQSMVGGVFRDRAGQHAGGFRVARRAAFAPAAARLARRGIHGRQREQRVEHETHTQADRDERHVSAEQPLDGARR